MYKDIQLFIQLSVQPPPPPPPPPHPHFRYNYCTKVVPWPEFGFSIWWSCFTWPRHFSFKKIQNSRNTLFSIIFCELDKILCIMVSLSCTWDAVQAYKEHLKCTRHVPNINACYITCLLCSRNFRTSVASYTAQYCIR